MINTEQTSGLSVLDHGFSVNEYFLDLYKHLIYKKDLNKNWKLPNWVYDDIIINSLQNINLDVINQYQIYHDCGKPYCLTIDENGKRHFPNHAELSYLIYLSVFGTSSFHKSVADLIKDDMLIHLLKTEDVLYFSENKNCLILLLTGLAEIHSNSKMFGGIDSVSFKIKWKHLNKKGNQLIKILTKQEK